MTGYVFVLPLLTVMGLFVFYPLVNTIRLSFFEYSFIENVSSFAGLDNYVSWFKDPRMLDGWWVSIKFFLYYVPANILISLVVALLIDRVANKYFASLYRILTYFPVVLPAAIVFQMWVWIYDPTLGVFAQVQDATGVGRPLTWLGSTDLALPALALMSIWRLTGETVIIFLVGLANIPRELIDAARVDGANELQVIRKVTLPLLKPFFFIVLVLRIKVLELIVEPLFMTEGGPVNSTMTYGLRAFYIFFHDDQLGYSATWFVMLSLVSILAAFIVWKRLRPETL